jgi:hypothetical protein
MLSELFCSDLHTPAMRSSGENHLRARPSLKYVSPKNRALNPRNPQPQNTGQAKGYRARGNAMRIISKIRSLLFTLLLLSLSAAAFAQIGISISFALSFVI